MALVIDRETGKHHDARQAERVQIQVAPEGQPSDERDSDFEVKIDNEWTRVASGEFRVRYRGVTTGDMKELTAVPDKIEE